MYLDVVFLLREMGSDDMGGDGGEWGQDQAGGGAGCWWLHL